jgi:hypothetical protein
MPDEIRALRELGQAVRALQFANGRRTVRATEEEIFDRLIEATGDSLAPHSIYQYRVDRRRMRRYRRGLSQ